MMQLQTFGPAFGQPDASPFCVKAMCFLHLSNVSWRPLPDSDPRKAPYQKLPVLLHGTEIIADSDNIRQYLESNTGTDFDAGLSSEQRAQSRALIRMVEDHLYFCLVYDRWLVDESWLEIRKHFFAEFPAPMRWFIPDMVRRNVIKALKGQGVGRLEYPRMLERACKDITAIKEVLGDKAYLFGDQPSAADISVISVLTAVAASPAPSELKECVSKDAQLTAYCARGQTRLYPPL